MCVVCCLTVVVTCLTVGVVVSGSLLVGCCLLLVVDCWLLFCSVSVVCWLFAAR